MTEDARGGRELLAVPAVILLGAPGTGKSVIASALARALGVGLVENEDLASKVLGSPVAEKMIDDPEGTLETLRTSALETIAPNGVGSGAVVVLNASAPLDPQVLAALSKAKEQGSRVVALTAGLSTLVKRNGLNAPQPVALGTPRAWFRSHLQALETSYLLIAEYWCDTDTCDPDACASRIATNLEQTVKVR